MLFFYLIASACSYYFILCFLRALVHYNLSYCILSCSCWLQFLLPICLNHSVFSVKILGRGTLLGLVWFFMPFKATLRLPVSWCYGCFLVSCQLLSTMCGFGVEGAGACDPHRASFSIGSVDVFWRLTCYFPRKEGWVSQNYNHDVSLIFHYFWVSGFCFLFFVFANEMIFTSPGIFGYLLLSNKPPQNSMD